MQSALRDKLHKKSSKEEDEVASPVPEEHLTPFHIPGQNILTDTGEGTLQPSPPPHCPSAEGLDKIQRSTGCPSSPTGSKKGSPIFVVRE